MVKETWRNCTLGIKKKEEKLTFNFTLFRKEVHVWFNKLWCMLRYEYLLVYASMIDKDQWLVKLSFYIYRKFQIHNIQQCKCHVVALLNKLHHRNGSQQSNVLPRVTQVELSAATYQNSIRHCQQLVLREFLQLVCLGGLNGAR